MCCRLELIVICHGDRLLGLGLLISSDDPMLHAGCMLCKLCHWETFSRAIRTSCQGISGTVNVMEGLERGTRERLFVLSNTGTILPVLNWLILDNCFCYLKLLTSKKWHVTLQVQLLLDESFCCSYLLPKHLQEFDQFHVFRWHCIVVSAWVLYLMCSVIRILLPPPASFPTSRIHIPANTSFSNNCVTVMTTCQSPWLMGHACCHDSSRINRKLSSRLIGWTCNGGNMVDNIACTNGSLRGKVHFMLKSG